MKIIQEVESFVSIEHSSEEMRYFVADEISPRAYCGNCGSYGYRTGIWRDPTRIVSIACPVVLHPTGGCMIVEYEYYRVGECGDCGIFEILSYIDTEYEVECRNLGRVYDIIPGATMENGYDVHECLDPNDYF